MQIQLIKAKNREIAFIYTIKDGVENYWHNPKILKDYKAKW